MRFSRIFAAAAVLFAALATPSFAQVRNIGPVNVEANANTLPVRVSVVGAPAGTSLPAAVERAFRSHGRYDTSPANQPAYDIKFTVTGAAQVRLDIARGAGGAPVASEPVTGATLAAALFRAADIAVEKTNGLGLKGYFSSKLAFVRSVGTAKEIYTGDLFFTSVTELTGHRVQVLFPRWSPDGSRILYTSYLKGVPDVYRIDIGAKKLDSLLSFVGTNIGARYSPDGRRIAFIASSTGAGEIYVADAQGASPVRLTYQPNFVKATPVWSPSGDQILFAMEPGPQLYVMQATPRAAPRKVSGGIAYAAEPDWNRANPDKIAFTQKVDGRYQIAVLSLSSGASKVVSNAPFDAVEPSWLPDGRHLVYTAKDRTSQRLHILDTETGRSTAISVSGAEPAFQANVWAP